MKWLFLLLAGMMFAGSGWGMYTQEEFKKIYEKAIEIYPQLEKARLWEMYVNAQSAGMYVSPIATEQGIMRIKIEGDTILLNGKDITGNLGKNITQIGSGNQAMIDSPNSLQTAALDSPNPTQTTAINSPNATQTNASGESNITENIDSPNSTQMAAINSPNSTQTSASEASNISNTTGLITIGALKLTLVEVSLLSIGLLSLIGLAISILTRK